MPPKRPAPSRSHAQNMYPRQETIAAAAKTRTIKNVSGPTEEESDISEEMKAKLARKEARTIRNRESARRSRNQRKAHLAWLENRVLELETENQALRGEPSGAESKVKEESAEKVTERSGYSTLRTSSSASKSSSSSVHPFFTSAATSTLTRCSSHPNLSYSRTGVHSREPSPAHSVFSLATDLGLPTELVSGGAGVRLASVTPPSKGMLSEMGVDGDDDDDDRVVGSGDRIGIGNLLHSRLGYIQPSPSSFEEEEAQLKEENALLRERVGLLENLVKQVVVLSNLNPNLALLPISVTMPNVSPPAPALPSSMLLNTPLPTRGLSLSQMSLPMPIRGLNSMSISMPTPLSPYSTSEGAGAMQATRTGSGTAADIGRVESLWAQESTHAGQQPDSGAPGAQSYPSQFYIPHDYAEELAHPSHIPPRRLSVQVGQPLGQVGQME
ncbi:hypothetical protein I314_06513 [Cryptococcus bacillisporus CA1873]|uniref:BZIP domain-containing protein n=1 Tax=Cryptococcus bacillisporus CA1873 TaxID=1296111 RepID=A0ABR5B200_CRYGA|nr:hypothetical protein I314_06513 [Cryptococcus bacillisporus CA1873]|eukprot:KIR57621.1 hypothetical protein I314_06513 [Cryptococcus gattii CA1873]